MTITRRAFLAAAGAVAGCSTVSTHDVYQCAESRRGLGAMDSYIDEKTGARVRMLTRDGAEDQVVYQTHPMWTPGMRHFVFSSKRTGGAWRPHALDMATGHIRCLAEGAEDFTIARKTDCFIYRKGDILYTTPVDAAARRADHPRTAGVFEGLAAMKPISMTLDAGEDVAYVAVILEPDKKWGVAALPLDGGPFRTIAEVDFRVGHVQANPFVPGLVMFCHETGGDAPQRMWVVLDGDAAPSPFSPETYGEWVTHEAWWGPDRAIFTIWPYDEEHKNQNHGVVSVDLATMTRTLHAQYPAWHTQGSPDGRWVMGDDFDRNLWLIKVATGERRLLTQGHLGKGCKTHPHASFTPDGKGIVFNSSKFGTEDIFLVEIPEWKSLPKLG